MTNCQYRLDDIDLIAKKIVEEYALYNPASTTKIIAFEGEMGAGKTTLIKAIAMQLGINSSQISSPTYSLVNEYFAKKNDLTIYHFDFYRIKDEQEALDMGIEDYFYSQNICLIEWAERIPNLLPSQAIKITIEVENNFLRNIIF